MATIKQGILGAFSGKVGSVVGSSWKGIPIMKSLPPSVSNPKTAGQVEQRSKMTNCVAAAKEILAEVIKPLNDRFVSRMSGYNAFVSRNISLFDSDGLAIPADLKISQSRNKAQLIDALAAGQGLKALRIDWTSDAGTGFALGSDKPFVVVYNRNTNKWYGFAASSTRDADKADVEFPDGALTEDDVLDVYLAFLRDDGTVVFDTGYSSTTVTA